MKLTHCACGARLFFGNTTCTRCGRDVGWCDLCRSTASVSGGNCDRCGGAVAPCPNRVQYEVCNCFVSAAGPPVPLCRSCRMTVVAPDLSMPGNITRWGLLEQAKRRLLLDLDELGFDERHFTAEPPLRFQFLADLPNEPAITGHADGLITINLKEADPVQREESRQRFGEPHRTLIGHMRHEWAHVLWMRRVQGRRERECARIFGDHTDPPYGEAMPRYYEQGPPADWSNHYISQYASSHPWEDFAETAAFYLDMSAVLSVVATSWTAVASGPTFDDRLEAYCRSGIAFNEVNRALGLTDALPETLNPDVVEKLRYIDQLIRQHD